MYSKDANQVKTGAAFKNKPLEVEGEVEKSAKPAARRPAGVSAFGPEVGVVPRPP